MSQRLCEGLILSKKGFGEGHLSINFLDAEIGKVRVTAYGAALETGKRRSTLLTGSFVEGLITQNPRNPEYYILSDTKLIFSLDNIREELKSIGFAFYLLEILDMMLLEGDLFPYYADLLGSFELFEDNLDEKYILFFLAKFLGGEGWLHIPEEEKLHETTKRFINDSQTHSMDFLQGKNISQPRRRELAYFFAHAVKRARNRMPNSLELLRFGDF